MESGRRQGVVVDRDKYNAYLRAHRAKDKLKWRLYKRSYNRAWRLKHGYHNERNSHLRYPTKEKARRLLRNAVRRGDVRKQSCERCSEKRAQAHHDDYSQPLKVRWLCALHHKEAHTLSP